MTPFLVVVLALFGLSPAVPQFDIRSACESAAVLSADAGWAKAAAAKDLDGLMSFYDTNATQWPPTGAAIVGKEALRQLFDHVFADPDYALSWSADKVSIAKSCDLAYTLGRWEIKSRNREGQLTTTRGTYLAVWRRSNDGRWLVLEDMFNRAGG